MPQVGVAAAEPRLRKKRRDLGGKPPLPARRAGQHHVGKPRRQRQRGKAAAMGGEAAGPVAPPKPVQKLERL